MTTLSTAAGPFALVCMDRRRPQHGRRYQGLTFPTAAVAHRWADLAGDATRAELVRDGYRVQEGGDR
jgi:hypothetical protein